MVTWQWVCNHGCVIAHVDEWPGTQWGDSPLERERDHVVEVQEVGSEQCNSRDNNHGNEGSQQSVFGSYCPSLRLEESATVTAQKSK